MDDPPCFLPRSGGAPKRSPTSHNNRSRSNSRHAQRANGTNGPATHNNNNSNNNNSTHKGNQNNNSKSRRNNNTNDTMRNACHRDKNNNTRSNRSSSAAARSSSARRSGSRAQPSARSGSQAKRQPAAAPPGHASYPANPTEALYTPWLARRAEIVKEFNVSIKSTDDAESRQEIYEYTAANLDSLILSSNVARKTALDALRSHILNNFGSCMLCAEPLCYYATEGNTALAREQMVKHERTHHPHLPFRPLPSETACVAPNYTGHLGALTACLTTLRGISQFVKVDYSHHVQQVLDVPTKLNLRLLWNHTLTEEFKANLPSVPVDDDDDDGDSTAAPSGNNRSRPEVTAAAAAVNHMPSLYTIQSLAHYPQELSLTWRRFCKDTAKHGGNLFPYGSGDSSTPASLRDAGTSATAVSNGPLWPIYINSPHGVDSLSLFTTVDRRPNRPTGPSVVAVLPVAVITYANNHFKGFHLRNGIWVTSSNNLLEKPGNPVLKDVAIVILADVTNTAPHTLPASSAAPTYGIRMGSDDEPRC